MKILVIVPAYNEAASIGTTVRMIREKAPGTDVLVINDGSGDDTLEKLKTLDTAYLDLKQNLGIGGAVQSGYLYAKKHGYDYAVQIDGDGQHDPSYILPMIRWMEEEKIDVGIGSRFLTGEGFQSNRMRRTGIAFLSRLIRITCGAKVLDVTSGYRIANKKYIGIFAENYSDDYPESDSIPLIVRTGGRVAEYPVIMQERKSGRSSIDMGRSVYYMIKVSISILLNRQIYKKTAEF